MALAVIAAVLLFGGRARAQQPDAQRVAAVKAGMVVNFVRYTTWPATAFQSPESPIVITIVGDTDIAEALAAASRGQTINNRTVEVRRLRYPPTYRGELGPRGADLSAFYRDLRASHAAYFGESERSRVDEYLRELRTASVLTISSLPEFAERGGMLGFAIRERRVAFDANEDVIYNSPLKVSSQVLKLAKIVGRRPERSGPGGGGGGSP